LAEALLGSDSHDVLKGTDDGDTHTTGFKVVGLTYFNFAVSVSGSELTGEPVIRNGEHFGFRATIATLCINAHVTAALVAGAPVLLSDNTASGGCAGNGSSGEDAETNTYHCKYKESDDENVLDVSPAGLLETSGTVTATVRHLVSLLDLNYSLYD
jgi:hypothetical protein